MLSPRLGGESLWGTEDYDEAAHYLKIRYEEGEIDFIVSALISDIPLQPFDFAGRNVPIEAPAEIALKKLYHRAEMLKPRDIFDVAVVMTSHRPALDSHLSLFADVKDKLCHRISVLPKPYYERALDDLDIFPPWEHLKPLALDMVAELVEIIPISPPLK